MRKQLDFTGSLNASRRGLRTTSLEQQVEERRANDDRAVGTDKNADEHSEREGMDARASKDVQNEDG